MSTLPTLWGWQQNCIALLSCLAFFAICAPLPPLVDGAALPKLTRRLQLQVNASAVHPC